MKKHIQPDPWCIIEEGFDSENQLASESLFSIANGKMGQRGFFEENYSGESNEGSYIGGIYFPEKVTSSTYKKGMPERTEKIACVPNWTKIYVRINDDKLNLATWDVKNFRRVLNMREGFLERSFEATSVKGHRILVTTKRFLSMSETEVGAISYTIKSLNFEGRISFSPVIEGDVKNYYTRNNESFWNILQTKTEMDVSYLWAQTKKLDFHVCGALTYVLYKNNEALNVIPSKIEKEKTAGFSLGTDVRIGDTVCLNKYVAILSSLDHMRDELTNKACIVARDAKTKGWNKLFEEHSAVWAEKWTQSDVVIDSDLASQQAIRFSIFQLNQTYSGKDDRLNISFNGFSGEKMNGTTRWNADAICVPYFLLSAPKNISRNLILYRYKQLAKAIENAEILGFTNGAALYPAATFNGTESDSEWELTLEEIHRNGIIALAIKKYVSYTGDWDYLAEYGLKVLISISRFWVQRVNKSTDKNKYMLLGVTGPNSYENNANNNWFTNYMAVWTLQYTIECIQKIKNSHSEIFQKTAEFIHFNENEISRWKDIAENMYFPMNNDLGIFLQQDGYLDKTIAPTSEIPENELPIIQHWSWDRILRSSYVKQADVVLGLYFFERDFSLETLQKNFEFYEALTVHESSWSFSIHSIVASKIGDTNKAYQHFLQSARLDLDDYLNEVNEGLHITSMAGTWLALVEGFAGLRELNGEIHFDPQLPENWNAISFSIVYCNNNLNVRIDNSTINFNYSGDEGISIFVRGQKKSLPAGTSSITY